MPAYGCLVFPAVHRIKPTPLTWFLRPLPYSCLNWFSWLHLGPPSSACPPCLATRNHLYHVLSCLWACSCVCCSLWKSALTPPCFLIAGLNDNCPWIVPSTRKPSLVGKLSQSSGLWGRGRGEAFLKCFRVQCEGELRSKGRFPGRKGERGARWSCKPRKVKAG